MIEFKHYDLLNSVPPNLLKDEKIKNLAKVLSKQNQKLAEAGEKLNFVENIRTLPEAVVDYLLWEKNIGYNEGLILASTYEEKVALLESAIKLKRIKGTPAAIELIFDLLNINTVLKEWFEYGGQPYHFMLEVTVTDRGLSEDMVTKLENLVLAYKNTRSKLEAIDIFLTSKGTYYIGACMQTGEEITIYPWTVTNIEVSGKYHLAVGQAPGVETTVIYPQGGAINE